MSLQDSTQIENVKVLLKVGADGRGIAEIVKVGTSGVVDTYDIVLSDGTRIPFDVTNGSSIDSIEKTATVGLVDTYTITLTNGDTFEFEVTNADGSTAGTVNYDNTGSGLDATNVQDAIDEVNDDKANKTDLTSISQSGATATQSIPSGTYFYLNGVLVRAKTNIASGATFTLNTNYEVVTAGGLNSLANAMKIKTKTFSGTTGTKGQILMMSNISTTIIPIFVKIDSGAYTMISFDGAGTSLYAHLENDNGVIANTSVSGTLYYFEQ